jgi:tRNA pseudouridine38-40 synthase
MRWMIRLAYDGTEFHGWQFQPNGRSVQEELERALAHIAGRRQPIIGAGRTDTGVHAERQYAHFEFESRLSPTQMRLALQTQLPPDIRIDEARIVHPQFHARYDALKRTYRYDIARDRTPFNRFHTVHFKRFRIRPEVFPEYLKHFVGTHDFSAFAKHDNDLENHICVVEPIAFFPTSFGWSLRISANRFLHNMVRRIVGCTVFLSDHELPPETIDELIRARRGDQKLIFTAPPEGLFLEEVEYPESRLTQIVPEPDEV